ncbi:MAG: hypothetical protein VX498_13030, partial [Myxococcota bacterium]|nr:hypothetical protein [Myxococcota bacterium]
EVPEAIEAFDDYIARTQLSEPGEAARGRLRLAILLQRQERYQELSTVLDAAEAFEGFDGTETWELRALRAIALGAEGSFRVSESELNRVRSEIRHHSRRTGDLFPYQAAMVWYFAGELDRMQARSIVLDSVDDLELLDRQIGEKADLLMDARQRFKRTLEHGEPTWSGPAALALGGVYEDFRADLLAAPAPSDLEPDVREVYESLLRERTQQFLGAAVKDYRSVLELARFLDLEPPWIAAVSGALERCEEALAEAPGEAR